MDGPISFDQKLTVSSDVYQHLIVDYMVDNRWLLIIYFIVICFTLPVETEVSIAVYNLYGREVFSLINGNMQAGYHSIVWDANSYSSGVYFVKMIAGEFVNTQKLMLIK